MNCGTLKGWEQHRTRNERPCKFCAPYDPRLANPKKQQIIKRAPTTKKCGTRPGYNQHRARNEPVCETCRQYHNKEQRDRYKMRPPTERKSQAKHCGTPWGYQQHIANSDPDCPPCRLAANKKRKEVRDAAKAAANV